MKDKKIKWGSIVPLVGGMSVANKKTTGEDPSFLISYPAFAANDSHCKNHFADTPYIVVEPEENFLTPDEKFQDVDFVSTVCPCAGLSMLNSNKNGSKARGADAVQNEWMYKSARLVLEQIKPRVFWGENAPGLYTEMGAKVVENLRAIAKEFGYSFSLVKTDTFLHGIPQHRMRTFYFFWRDSEAPVFNYHKKQAPTLEEYLEQVPSDASLMDVYFGLGDITDNYWFLYAKEKGWSRRQLIETDHKTMLQWVLGEGYLEDLGEWCEKKENAQGVKFVKHVQNKISQGLGWWDGSPLIFKDAINALIAKNSGIVHPNKDRGLTMREAMHLMGLPHDFEMVGDGYFNHICQNVPVTTAADWTAEIVRFLKGEITDFGGSFVKQNNISQKVDYRESKPAKALF